MRLGRLAARLPTFDARRVAPPPKVADKVYGTPEHVEWRARVFAKAGGRCEAIEHGQRCTKAAPRHRMFADHIKEVRDGGALLDPDNGQLLCGSHHTAKTAAARASRHGGWPAQG